MRNWKAAESCAEDESLNKFEAASSDINGRGSESSSDNNEILNCRGYQTLTKHPTTPENKA
jgi:hypothetical protein